MTFQEMQKGVLVVADTYGKRFGITIDQDFALLKLYEEVGEYAQAVLIKYLFTGLPVKNGALSADHKYSYEIDVTLPA